ncbi:MAG: efflux transporter outer membrane subunit [Bacteroidota bacterium]|nr:efflux transporter outer membrane subunit [Bacteroidota bacterium]
MNRINIMRSCKILLYFFILEVILTSCKVTGNYKRPAGIAENGLYRDIKTNDSATIADIPWKQLFSDSLLLNLIGEGIDQNLDLKIAMARIKEAQANLQSGNAAFLPTLDLHATLTDQKPANNNPGISNYYQLYASSGWEIDLWGKIKSAKRAALALLMQSEAYRRAVQTQLVADIATNYYILLAYDAQLQVTLKTLENRKLDVGIMKQLKESDVVTGAAVVQSEANYYSVEVTIPDLKQNIRVAENTLCNLLGRSPGSIARDSIYNQLIHSGLQTGVPFQLLANRPDVREAEYQLRYYFELTNLAKTYFYPSLTITANEGFSNGKISNLFNSTAVFGNIVGGLAQPILNHGLNTQRLRVAKAQQEEALAAFKKTLLNAGQEVSNALANYRAATDKVEFRSQQIVYLQKAVEFTKELLKYTANTNYTDVLTSEQSLLAAQLNSISDKLQQLLANVTLYRSLGGGWR